MPLLSVLSRDTRYHHVPKATLTFLVLGALSVNALAVLVARSPAPEPEREFSRSLSTHRGLTFVSFSFVTMEPDPPETQELDARIIPLIGEGISDLSLKLVSLNPRSKSSTPESSS